MEPLKFTVGIDIGGTNTKLGLVDSEGHLLRRVNFSTNPLLCFADYQILLTSALEEVTNDIPTPSKSSLGMSLVTMEVMVSQILILMI